MFFDMDLLCRQRNGKFALIWLAATRGLINLKKRDIEKVDINRTCNEILQFVMSKSTMPRKRLSLYLSANLMYGTVLVYYQQVAYFEKEIISAVVYLKRPVYKCLPEDDQRKKRKSRTKRSKKEKNVVEEIPLDVIGQQVLQDLPNIGNIADATHITMRETVISRIETIQQDPLGDEELNEQQLDQLESFILGLPSTTAPIPIPDLPAVPEVDNQTFKRPHQTSKDAEEPVQKRPRLEAPTTPTLVQEQRPVEAPTELTVAEIQENLQQPPPPRPARIRPRTRRLNVNVLLKTQDFTLMRSSSSNSIFFADKKKIVSRPQVETKDILAEFLRGIPYVEEEIISAVREREENFSTESGPILRAAGEHGQTLETVVEGITDPTLHVTDIPPEQSSIQASFIPSPRLSRIAPLTEEVQELPISRPTEVPEMEHIRRVHTSTPVHSYSGVGIKFQRSLLERIKQIFFENNNLPIKLEEICFTKKRIDIARTFNCLLHLQVQRYIKMTSCANSVKLDLIYPGEHL